MMKFTKILLAAVVAAMAIPLVGCDSETHPDPHLVKSMNDQRAAQQSGQTPPTGK